MSSTALETLRSGLVEVLAAYKGSPCSFWACPGVTDEIVNMATCNVCAMQIEIKALLSEVFQDGTR